MEMQVLTLSDGVYLDGNKIEGIKAINIDSSVDSLSEVTLKIVCQVEGVDHIVKMNESTDVHKITAGTLSADNIFLTEQQDWQVMKDRMLERTELIKQTRKRKDESENNPSGIGSSQEGLGNLDILSELKEIKAIIKDYVEKSVEREYRAAQLNAYALNDPKRMSELDQHYPVVKSTDDENIQEVSIPLMIDEVKIGEMITRLLNQYHKQAGSTKINL